MEFVLIPAVSPRLRAVWVEGTPNAPGVHTGGFSTKDVAWRRGVWEAKGQ